MRPLIGITPSVIHDNDRGEQLMLGLTYSGAVESAGGLPVILSPQRNAHHLLERLDGIILSGGGDIRPTRYGDQHVHPTTYGISDRRDDFEFALLDAALARRMPLLAICRGIQVLNVFLGGTLWQDVSEFSTEALPHRQPLNHDSRHEPSHKVVTVEGSLLATTYGATEIAANSFHHQVLKKLGHGLAAIGHTADGAVEAVSLPGHSFVLGVQWHPEMMYARYGEHARPFMRLAGVAAAYGLRRSSARTAAD